MDIQDRHEIKILIREELDERFPEKRCPECGQWHPMVKFERCDDQREEYLTSYKCLYCGSEFVEELRKV